MASGRRHSADRARFCLRSAPRCAYKRADRSVPLGAERKAATEVSSRRGRAAKPGFPCSRLRSDPVEPFHGLEGLSVGRFAQQERKAHHGSLRACLYGASGRDRPAGRSVDRTAQEPSSPPTAVRSPRSNIGASSPSPSASRRTARRISRCSTSTRRRRRSSRWSASSASTKT